MFLAKLKKRKLNRNLYILLLFLVVPFSAIKAQYGNIQFIENRGQWDPSIKFVGQVSSGAFYINQRGFTVLQRDTGGWDEITAAMHKHGKKPDPSKAKKPIVLRSHVYKVEFLNANEKPRIVADKQIATYNNYIYGNDPSKWASNCKIYLGITMEEVYPNVDVRFYSNNGYVKYDIIAKPGADLSRIALKYEGADKLEIKNKELIVGTSVGNLKELSPYTYQYNEKGKVERSAKYVLKGNIVSFDIKGYDRSTTMIIDPSLRFCSFSGSTADNWGFTATYGPDGSMFGGGIVFDAGFPTTAGAYQGTYVPSSGQWPVDIGIIKLKPDGSGPPTYATYIGGSGSDVPQSLIVDGAGNLIIGGRSNSGNYPTTGTTGLIGPGGGFDIIITKLNPAGSALVGSKRIGGSVDDGDNITPFGGGANSLQRNYGDEGRSEVLLDPSGNILLASCTKSNDFPTVSAFQGSNGGAQDGVILRMTSDVSTLLFSTYIGGSENDAAYVLAVNPINGDVYAAGGTESTATGPGQTLFPGNKAGTVGPTPGGGIDGFIAQISGTTLTRTTYIGKSNYDQIYGIQFDRFGFPYIMGQTKNSWTAVNAPFFMNNGKQFIAKLQPDLSAYVYFTLFGPPTSEPNISPVAFLVDRCENVYISGWGGGFGPQTQWDYPTAGTSGLPVTSDAIKGTTDGRDFYFFVLEKNAVSQLYGSFFGENNATQVGLGCDHVDGGTSRFDQNGVIYQAICGNCKSFGFTTFPTTPGAWATSNPAVGGGECNLAMVKIEFNLAGVKAGVVSAINGVPRDSAGCVPLTVDFRDTVQSAVTYEWNFGDSPAWGVTTHPDTSHTYTAVGTYIVTLVAVDSSSCNIRDTSYMTIRVGDLQATVNFNPVKLDPCDSFKYRFDNLSVAPGARPFTDSSFVWDFGDGTPPLITGAGPVFHNFASPRTYDVKLLLRDTAYCNAPDSMVIQLRVAALVKARFDDVPPGCAPYTITFNNTSDAGQTFQWDFGDGQTSNEVDPQHIYNTPGTYIVVLTANDPGTCNLTDVFRDTIIVSPIPLASFNFTPEPPLENTPTIFSNTSSPDAVRFVWKFGDGDSLVTTSRADVTHQYKATGTFNACLTVTNAFGCADDTCRTVRALILPLVAVPNAFTPLTGDGNSRVFVRGFGIAKMRFIIWNRWGQKVFETNDQNIGWDGKFKGTVQPMDVYAYTLDVEFFDGTKANKKGDITLIR